MPTFIATKLDVTQYVGKADIVRQVKGDPNSTFLRLRVHTDRANEGMVLVRRANVITGKPELMWVSPYTTTPEDAVVLKIETIAYSKNDPMGATALDGVNRWFESVDTAYVAVKRETIPAVVNEAGETVTPASRNTVVETFMRYDRTNKAFITNSGMPLAYAESNDDLACWSGDFLARLDSNTAALDHRVKDWTLVKVGTDGKKTKEEIVTAYGMFLLQRERDANSRKKIVKA